MPPHNNSRRDSNPKAFGIFVKPEVILSILARFMASDAEPLPPLCILRKLAPAPHNFDPRLPLGKAILAGVARLQDGRRTAAVGLVATNILDKKNTAKKF